MSFALKVPVFEPTFEEFSDFRKYVTSIEPLARDIGLCKIIPPREWRESQPNFGSIINKVLDPDFQESQLDEVEQAGAKILDSILIKNPLEQQFQGKGGCYSQLNLESRKKFSLYDFKRFSEGKMKKTPEIKCSTDEEKYAELYKIYWKTLSFSETYYGADMAGTLFPDDFKIWNISRLDNILTDIPMNIPGVNSSYLYFGMWKASFAWHVEDLDLFSINYIHFGEPKQWFCIPPKYKSMFERLCQHYFPEGFQRCSEYLRHKSSILSPSILRHHKIPYVEMLHKEGEIMITFPYGYHSGFNYGFNCAESVNFAFESWLEIGRKARVCRCNSDSVKMNFDDVFQTYFRKLIPKIKIPSKVCILCGKCNSENLIKTDSSYWAHKDCALHTTGISLLSNGEMACGVEDILELKNQTECCVCNETVGIPAQCSHSDCIKSFHISCLAQVEQISFMENEQVFCPSHIKLKRQKLFQ